MNNSNSSTTYSDEYLQEILERTNTIAMIGLSADENRPSNFAAKYLQTKGYKVIPINPVTKNKFILREKINPNLEIINKPLPIDTPQRRMPDIRLARKYLDWKPIVDLNNGLDPTIEYFRKILSSI